MINNLIEALRFYAQMTPQRAAVFDKNGSMTYEELNKITDLAALELLEKGIASGSFAAVYVRRDRNILAGALAAMKAGAAYMPLDPDYPEERLTYMLRNAEASFLLTEHPLWDVTPVNGFEGTLIFLDDLPAVSPDREEKDKLLLASERIRPDGRAMLLYTSGTTGNPKGVVHTHSSVKAISDTFPKERNPLGPESRVGVFTGFTTIASALCLFAPLFEGGAASVICEELRSDIDGLYRYLRKLSVTHIFLAPSLGKLLAEKYDMRGMTLLLGGEKVQPIKTSAFPDVADEYGSTEGVIIAGHWLTENETEIPLGKPTEGTEIRIADESLNPVKTGQTGELLYSSGFMAKEYLGLPGLSAEKWILLDGKRFFRTGDRVKTDSSGMLWYVGRADDMVKLRGYRIELGEVDSCIAKAGGTGSCCAVRKVRGADKLCCFYEEKSGFDPEKIKKEVSGKLASYMVPELWIPLDELPKNANGKIMRRLLPVPEIGPVDYVAPKNDVDAMIVRKMEELLNVPKIGMKDSFAAMGGDSLRAMSLSSSLRQHGIILSSADILMSGTVEEMCGKARVQYERIWDEDEWAAIRQNFADRGETIEKVLPLTREQEALLMKQLLYPDNPENIGFYSFLIDESPEEKNLRSALDKMSSQFPELRTAVVYKGVSAIQQVLTDRRVPLKMVNVRNRPEANLLAASFREENGPFSFDPQDTPLLRFACIRLPGKESLVLAAAHRFLMGENRLKKCLSEFFRELGQYSSGSEEIASWAELLSMTDRESGQTDPEQADGSYISEALKNTREASDGKGKGPASAVFTYSRVSGARKIVFIHTANTGSEAYYSLAKRIGKYYSFAVMEQYNLYHPGKEIYGIKNLAKKYLEILKEYQPEGPYCLGGWCYGGMIAYEVACLLKQAGEKVDMLILLDSQIAVGEKMNRLSRENQKTVKRSYFETCPLFEDMRTRGMLESLILNYQHVAEDVVEYVPSEYSGRILYFKPEVVPSGSEGAALAYQQAILSEKAGGYEAFTAEKNLKIVLTPHEHDLMMDDASLDVIVPEISENLLCRSFRLPAEMSSWDTVKNFLLAIPGKSRGSLLELCLIAEEIMVNIISYAYEDRPETEKMIGVSVETAGNFCRLTFTDGGIPFNPQSGEERKKNYDPLARIGGAGRILVADFADATSYEYKDGKNIFTIEKNLAEEREER